MRYVWLISSDKLNFDLTRDIAIAIYMMLQSYYACMYMAS